MIYLHVLYCNVPFYTVLYCTVPFYTVLYCTVLYCTVLYCTVLYCTVLYCTVLYCTVLYCTDLFTARVVQKLVVGANMQNLQHIIKYNNTYVYTSMCIKILMLLYIKY